MVRPRKGTVEGAWHLHVRFVGLCAFGSVGGLLCAIARAAFLTERACAGRFVRADSSLVSPDDGHEA